MERAGRGEVERMRYLSSKLERYRKRKKKSAYLRLFGLGRKWDGVPVDLILREGVARGKETGEKREIV